MQPYEVRYIIQAGDGKKILQQFLPTNNIDENGDPIEDDFAWIDVPTIEE